MKLLTLLKNCKYHLTASFQDVDIQRVCSNSQKVQKGDLFIDFSGSASYSWQALKNQAVGVLTKQTYPFEGNIVSLPFFERDIFILINRFFKAVDQQLSLIAVTGTSGKTTVSYCIYHILKQLGLSCGLMGTIETLIEEEKIPSQLTTPDLLTCYSTLQKMHQVGIKNCVMEVSSHGLDQKRVEGIGFDYAIFTNLTHEHLDYHKTLNEYKAAKKKLFSGLKNSAKAIINIDDSSASYMGKEILASCVTYGIYQMADYKAENIRSSLDRTSFDLVFDNKSYSVTSSLIGFFNVYNILACIACCHQKGLPLTDVIDAVLSFRGARGRLERLNCINNYHIYIDYAHKPDALENVLRTLKQLTRGKLITVVGCGGERDRSKRPLMAHIAQKYSSHVVLTSDNPRKEDPIKILEDMKQGLKSDVFCILQRDVAIRKAIELASKDDIILIAGKGHETYQIVGDKRNSFDDKEVVYQILS